MPMPERQRKSRRDSGAPVRSRGTVIGFLLATGQPSLRRSFPSASK
jgi:hypothetical protein